MDYRRGNISCSIWNTRHLCGTDQEGVPSSSEPRDSDPRIPLCLMAYYRTGDFEISGCLRQMRKIIVLVTTSILVALLVGGILLYNAYYNSFYAMDRANAFFSRAETAGFAEDMIAYLQQGRELLPTSGNPVWWFPTHITDFSEIQRDIDGIIARARLLVGLPRDGAAYQQGMDDLRGKIRTLEFQVGEASGFMFVSLSNVLGSLVWLALFVGLIYVLKRHSGKRE